MAAAVGALIWSHNPGWTASQVETQLYNSADNIDAYLSSAYIGKMGAGRINLYNAVNTGTPPPVANWWERHLPLSVKCFPEKMNPMR